MRIFWHQQEGSAMQRYKKKKKKNIKDKPEM
jgi:hypothetical protein